MCASLHQLNSPQTLPHSAGPSVAQTLPQTSCPASSMMSYGEVRINRPVHHSLLPLSSSHPIPSLSPRPPSPFLTRRKSQYFSLLTQRVLTKVLPPSLSPDGVDDLFNEGQFGSGEEEILVCLRILVCQVGDWQTHHLVNSMLP